MDKTLAREDGGDMYETTGYEIREDVLDDGTQVFDVYQLTTCDSEYVETYYSEEAAIKHARIFAKDHGLEGREIKVYRRGGTARKAAEECASTKVQEQQPGNAGYWIVKLSRRKDQRKYYIHEKGMTTARVDHLMMLGEDDAKKLAYAIKTQHPDFTARAMQCPKRFLQKPSAKKARPKRVHRAAAASAASLAACPHCHGLAEVHEVSDTASGKLFAVRCCECGCGTPYLETREAAVARWNARNHRHVEGERK